MKELKLILMKCHSWLSDADYFVRYDLIG